MNLFVPIDTLNYILRLSGVPQEQLTLAAEIPRDDVDGHVYIVASGEFLSAKVRLCISRKELSDMCDRFVRDAEFSAVSLPLTERS